MEYAAARLTTEVSRAFKATHIKTLIDATYSNQVSMSELFRVLSVRLRDDRWICVFKSLSLIHLLMREGNSERILGYLCGNLEYLSLMFYKQQAFDQTKWIKTYSSYLEEKTKVFKDLKFDWIRNRDEAVAKIRTMDDVSELLKQTEFLQSQIDAAIACKWEVNGMSDVVLQQGFRLIIAEIIGLFHLGNEAAVRILGLYFEMEHNVANKALELYKKFTIQSRKMEEIFEVAKQNRHTLNIQIPVFKSPPSSLVSTLEDYLNAPDFEAQRRAFKEKKLGKKASIRRDPAAKNINSQQDKPLVDFFSTVEEEMTHYNRAASPVQETFNSFWDPDEFARQNALQQNVQQQILATNALLNTTKSPILSNGFAQQLNGNNFYQGNAFTMNQPVQASSTAISSVHNPFAEFNSATPALQPGSTFTGVKEKPGFNIDSVFGPNTTFPNTKMPSNTLASQGTTIDPFSELQLQQKMNNMSMMSNNGFSVNNNVFFPMEPVSPFMTPQMAPSFTPFMSPQIGTNTSYTSQQISTSKSPYMNSQMGGTGLNFNNGNPFAGGASITNSNYSFGGLNSNPNMNNNSAVLSNPKNPFGGQYGNTGLSGNNQGSVLNSFHAPQSTHINTSLGSFAMNSPSNGINLPRNANINDGMMMNQFQAPNKNINNNPFNAFAN